MNDGIKLLATGGATLATAFGVCAQDACLESHLTAFDGGPSQNFGRAVAVSGGTVLIGASWDNDNGAQSGSVYAFMLDRGLSEPWVFTQKLLASNGRGGDQFGRALAMDGEVALIAAPGHVGDGGGNGSVYVFRPDPEGSGSWIEDQEIFAFDSEFQDVFGISVSIDGDVVLIGASLDDDNGGNSGSAYVFRYHRDSSQWVEEQKLLASDGVQGDFFGTSVAIVGDLAFVGAPGSDDACPADPTCDSGAVYVFRLDPRTSQWGEHQKLLASDGASGDDFGESVSTNGEATLVGAPFSGAAYLYAYDADQRQWIEQRQLIPSDGPGGSQFGDDVALDGDTALVGAWNWSSGIGSAYVFRNIEGIGWVEQTQLFGNESTFFFGRSVALCGDTAVVGANGENAQAGAAYVFDVSPNCNCPADANADGDVDVQDLVNVLLAWGTDDSAADINDDGIVDVLDLIDVIVAWGPCGP